MEPVHFGQVAFGNRDKACQPRFGGEQIVVRRVELARAIRIRKAIADRKETSLSVVQKPEIHSVCEGDRPVGDIVEVFRKIGRVIARGGNILCQSTRPVVDFIVARAGRAFHTLFGRDELRDALAEPRELISSFGRARQDVFNGLDFLHQPARAFCCAGAAHRRDQRQAKHTRGVLESGAELRGRLGLLLQPAKPVGQCQQRRREVAAVDGGDVTGRERRETARVVPIEQVTLEPLHALDGGYRGIDSLGEFLGSDEPQIVSRKRREKPHADVGG